MSEETITTRREFLRSLARGVALGGLAVTFGWLLTRAETRCGYDYACPGCPAYADCTLPERTAAPAGPGGSR